ncbi:hypothetical protein ACHAWT_008595 [Skeletonema menzelii]
MMCLCIIFRLFLSAIHVPTYIARDAIREERYSLYYNIIVASLLIFSMRIYQSS